MAGNRILDLLAGKDVDRPPFWFMRQAGRYLPEYKAVRATCNGFLDLCYSPEKAAEVTLQPLRRFDMDAAIIFADILTVPHALGADVTFVEGEGPKIKPISSAEGVHTLSLDNLHTHLAPVYETVKITRSLLPQDKAVIGFCGAPWTVACYMVEGGSSKEFTKTKQAAKEKWFNDLINILVESSIAYLVKQVESGAQILQIFDSWSGLLAKDEFETFSIQPTQKIVKAVKQKFSHVPVIGFPKDADKNLPGYVDKTGVDAVSIDYTVLPQWAASHIPKNCVLQGNLDPHILAENKEQAVKESIAIMQAWKRHKFIFNLGHGILPHTPIENVEAVSDAVKAFRL